MRQQPRATVCSLPTSTEMIRQEDSSDTYCGMKKTDEVNDGMPNTPPLLKPTGRRIRTNEMTDEGPTCENISSGIKEHRVNISTLNGCDLNIGQIRFRKGWCPGTKEWELF